MSGITLTYKSVALLLLVISCIGNVNGLKCYECMQAHEDLQKLDPNNPDFRPEYLCKNRIPAGSTTTCPSSKPLCLKFEATVMGGKEAGFRNCAEKNWETVLEGKNKCKPISELALAFNFAKQKMTPESGSVCICDTDKCNS